MSAAKPSKKRKAKRQSTFKAEQHFVQGLVTRGEAVAKDGHDAPPPGVTHWLSGGKGKAATSVKRIRFSLK